MSAAYDVATLLASQGLGVFAAEQGWSINVGSEPDRPDTCLTIYDTGGLGPDTDELDRRPSFQIRARGKDYRTTWAKLHTARLYLQDAGPVVINATRYASFEASSDIIGLGKDDNDRHLFTLNFQVPLASNV